MLESLSPITRENAHQTQFLKILSYGNFKNLAWSHDEKTVAVASSRGIWFHSTDALEQPPHLSVSTSYEVNDVDFSLDDQMIASADDDGVVRVWDSATMGLIVELKAHNEAAVSVKFHPNGKQLLSGGADSTVHVWDTSNWSPVNSILFETKLPERWASYPNAEKASKSISQLCFTPDGNTLISYGYQYTGIFLHDASTYTFRRFIDTEHWIIPSLAFANEGHTVVAWVAWDKLHGYKCWNLDTTSIEDELIDYLYNPTSHSKHGLWARTYEGERRYVKLHNTITGETLTEYDFVANDTTLNADHTKAVRFHFLGQIELWDIAIRERLSTSSVFYRREQGYPVFSFDNSILAVAGYSGGGIGLWDTQKGIALGCYQPGIGFGKNNDGSTIWFDQAGNLRIIGGNYENQIQIWNVITGQQLHEFNCPKQSPRDGIRSFALSSDGRFFAVSTEEGPVRLWNIQTGNQEILWQQEGQTATCAQFSPDGGYLAIITDRQREHTITYKVARVINVSTHKELIAVRGFKCSFSPDGRAIFVTTHVKGQGQPSLIYDIKSRRKLGALPSFSPFVDHISFNHDGTIAATASHDSIELWDWRERKQLTTVAMPANDYILGASVSSDGKLIAVICGRYGEIYLFGIPIEEIDAV